MTAKLKSSRLREEVANFAGYCMGSSYGDWDPRVDAIQEQVLEGGRRFCSICGSCVSTTGGNSFESTTIIDEKDASRRTRRLSDEE
jgi:hypothetical protein